MFNGKTIYFYGPCSIAMFVCLPEHIWLFDGILEVKNGIILGNLGSNGRCPTATSDDRRVVTKQRQLLSTKTKKNT